MERARLGVDIVEYLIPMQRVVEYGHLQTLRARVYEGHCVEIYRGAWAIRDGDIALGLVAAVISLRVTGELHSRHGELEVGGGILYVLTRAVEWVQGNGNGRDERENDISLV